MFVRSGITWTQQAVLNASDGKAGDEFGFSVAVAKDVVVVGAPQITAPGATGAAYVFARSGAAWMQRARLAVPEGAAGHKFGAAAALDGDTGLVGAPPRSLSAQSDPGQAYVFARPANQLTALGPARVWLGLKNSDDVGLRIDVLAEVFVVAGTSRTKVGGGKIHDRPTGSSGFTNAALSTIALTLENGPVDVPPGAALEIELSGRRTCSGNGHQSGAVRMWYNGGGPDTGVRRDAGSRFGATTGGVSAEYFFRSDFALSTAPGSSRAFVDVAVNTAITCSKRPFVPFGTWSTTLP